jgi:hypothetical protein
MEDIMTPQEDINLENDFKMADKKPKYKGKGKGKSKGMSYTASSTVSSYNVGSRYTTPFGIKSNVPDVTIINPAESTSDNFYHLFCLHGDLLTLSETYSIDTPYDQIVNEVIYWQYFQEVVNKSNGNDYIDEYMFNKTFFRKWLNAISNGLQLYYNVESIMAFNSTPTNENPALVYMQSSFNPGVRRKHRDLRDLLTRMSIPRNMEAFINYMYQNFSYCDDPQTPIIRLNWRGVLYPAAQIKTDPGLDDTLTEALFDKVMADLNDTEVRKIDSMIGITNKYSKDKGRFLLPTSAKAVKDENFLTWWYNSPSIGDGVRVPSAANETTAVYFGKGKFPLDGLMYACSSIYNSKTGVAAWQPGLYLPWSGWKTPVADKRLVGNLTTYDGTALVSTNKTSMAAAIASGRFNALKSSDYTIATGTFDGGSFVNPSFQKIQTNSIANMRSSVEAAVRWLFS